MLFKTQGHLGVIYVSLNCDVVHVFICRLSWLLDLSFFTFGFRHDISIDCILENCFQAVSRTDSELVLAENKSKQQFKSRMELQ